MGLLDNQTHKDYYSRTTETGSSRFTQGSTSGTLENTFVFTGSLPPQTNDPLNGVISDDITVTVTSSGVETTIDTNQYRFIQGGSEITFGTKKWQRTGINPNSTYHTQDYYFPLANWTNQQNPSTDILELVEPAPTFFNIGQRIGLSPTPRGYYTYHGQTLTGPNTLGIRYTTLSVTDDVTIIDISGDRKTLTLSDEVQIPKVNVFGGSGTPNLGHRPQFMSTWHQVWLLLPTSKYNTLRNYNPNTQVTTYGATGDEYTDSWGIDHDPATKLSEVVPVDSIVTISWTASTFGEYQFVPLKDIISGFHIQYVGEGKIISKIKRADIQYHAMRALQELSFDTLKSIKSQEIEVPSSLTMILPHNYVNYVKLAWIDGSGIEHRLYPVKDTSNPFAITQDSDGDYTFSGDESLAEQTTSDSWDAYKSTTPSTNNSDDYEDDTYWPLEGKRYGLEPSHAQANGSFFIDELKGNIHFSSNISGKTIVLKYISDSLGTDEEMQVHKFAEEAVYKHIAYGILCARIGIPEYVINRFKREKFATKRLAKLRLSNLKIEELTQALRGKSKQIKH